MKEPLVSIIVPVFQVEQYLGRCLDSICKQTYRNVEILLVDDGSRDGSGDICDEYANNDPRIQVIHQENKGLSAARNKGIEISNGDYLTFVDSDDYLLHDKYIELLVEALKENKAQISMCGQITFGFDFQPNYEVVYDKTKVVSGRDILLQRAGVFGDCYWNVLAKLFDKSLFSDLRFPEGHLLEDTAILHRILLPASTVSVLGIRMYGKYLHQNSIMGTMNPKKKFMESMYAFNDRLNYYREEKDSELEKRALFEKTADKAIYYLRSADKAAADTYDDIPAEDRPSMRDLKEVFDYYFPGKKREGNHYKNKKRVILHIGQTKTGTTAIQAFLKRNRKELEKQGICFYQPVEFVVDSFRNAAFVATSVMKQNAPVIDELPDSQLRLEKWLFTEYAKPFENVIMSNEVDWINGIRDKDFWPSLRSYYENIFGTNIDFLIVVSLRRQDDWIFSNWKEYIGSLRVPEQRDFKTYLDDLKKEGVLDYRNGLQLLKETYGKDNLCVIPYNNKIMGGNGIIDDFCEIVGIKTNEEFVYPTAKFNLSITGEIAMAMQMIKRREVDSKIDKFRLEWAAEMLSEFYPETERLHPLSFDDRKELVEIYSDGNNDIAKEFLGINKMFDDTIDDYRILEYNPERDILNAQKIIDFAALLPERNR